MERGARVDIVDTNGWTPLHMASKHGNSDIVQYLVEKQSASLDATDHNGRTSLWLAAKRGHLDIFHYLSEQGACVNVADKDGITPHDLASAWEESHTGIEYRIFLGKRLSIKDDILILND